MITMVIDHEGNPTIDLAGYQGKGCQAVQDVFGRALGATSAATKKPEFHKQPVGKVFAKQ